MSDKSVTRQMSTLRLLVPYDPSSPHHSNGIIVRETIRRAVKQLSEEIGVDESLLTVEVCVEARYVYPE